MRESGEGGWRERTTESEKEQREGERKRDGGGQEDRATGRERVRERQSMRESKEERAREQRLRERKIVLARVSETEQENGSCACAGWESANWRPAGATHDTLHRCNTRLTA